MTPDSRAEAPAGASGLGPEAQDGEESGGQQKRLMPRGLVRIQHAAGDKGRGDAVGMEDKKAEKAQARAENGIEEILEAATPGRPRLGVEGQGR